MIKVAGVAVSAALLSVLLKRYLPELSTLLTLGAISLVFFSVLTLLEGFQTLVEKAGSLMQQGEPYIAAVMKCLAISVLSHLGASLCKDMGQNALASAVELAGTICALCVISPLIGNMLSLMGELV